jgi:outer membrane protein assembly factor BamB
VKSHIKIILIIGLTYLLQPDLAAADSSDPGGALLWQNRGQSSLFGEPDAIDAEGSVVVAAGHIMRNPFNLNSFDWFVRAVDAGTGVTLWEDRQDFAGLRDRVTAVAVHAGRAIVAGQENSGAQASDFVVRAYGLKTGALLWERAPGAAYSVVADGDRVFAAGSFVDSTGHSVLALIALDARTGATLWESETAGTPTQFGQFAAASTVRVQDERVFVAGDMSTAAHSLGSLVVQAHDRKTGALLWDHRMPDATLGPTFALPLTIADDVLFVGGGASTSDPNLPFDYLVTALDIRTGALLWNDQVHRQAGGLSAGFGYRRGRLFAYGWDCDETVFNCHGNIRAYDPKTGSLQWEDRFTGAGGDMNIPIPVAGFVVRGDQVFVGSGLANLLGDYEWTVRSYNGKDGSLRWESHTDDGGANDFVFAIKLLGDHLYATGILDNSGGTTDFAIRAYQTDDGGRCDD